MGKRSGVADRVYRGGMEHLETTRVREYWDLVEKFRKRRWHVTMSPDYVVTFHRLGSSVLCEIFTSLGQGSTRKGVGISHKSKTCPVCEFPGDRWNERIGKNLAFWRAVLNCRGVQTAEAVEKLGGCDARLPDGGAYEPRQVLGDRDPGECALVTPDARVDPYGDDPGLCSSPPSPPKMRTD